MIAIELVGAVDSAGTVSTFYLSTDKLVTEPTDTPVNVAFQDRILDPGTIGIHAFADGRTGGNTKLESGQIIIGNFDANLDSFLNYSFDGRSVTIRSGTSGAYPGSYPALFIGTVESVDASVAQIVLVLKDKQWKLTLPAITTLYGGTNSLPNGLDGVPTDIQGKAIPKTYGKVFNVSPPMVNSSKLTFQVNNGVVVDIPAVYDSGILITKGADFATSALLQAAAPGAGTYITCFAEGYFRLGTTPAGEITSDVTQGAAGANRTVAQILKQLATDAGLSGGEISSADVTALDTANSAVVGIFLSDSTVTFLTAMDQIATSVGAYYGFDYTGTLRMGQLIAPTGPPVVTLYDYNLIEPTGGIALNRVTAKDNGVPVWNVILNHTLNYTVQSSGLAGAVTAATRGYLANATRSVASADATIKNQWKLAGTMTVDTLLTSASDAATEAARLLAIYKVRRDIYEATISVDIFTANSLKLMDLVTVQVSRFGMDSGKLFRVIGYSIQLATNMVILTLWG
jgi:hypothetical protein